MEQDFRSTPKTIKAVERSYEIVDALGDLDGAGVTEIANHLDANKGTIYHHLNTLCELGYAVKDGDGGYHLGLKYLRPAHNAKSTIELLPLVQQQVDNVADESGELALFMVEECGEGVCVYTSSGRNAIQTDLYIGQRSRLHHTAVGKAILANLPTERADDILGDDELPQKTSDTITDPDELQETFEEIRDRGFALNLEESIPGLVGVGTPIKTPDGVVHGAISVIGPAKRLNRDYMENELAELLMRSANVAEINSMAI